MYGVQCDHYSSVLANCFPELHWATPARPKYVQQHGYWTNPKNQRTFLDNLASQLSILHTHFCLPSGYQRTQRMVLRFIETSCTIRWRRLDQPLQWVINESITNCISGDPLEIPSIFKSVSYRTKIQVFQSTVCLVPVRKACIFHCDVLLHPVDFSHIICRI